MRFTLTYTGSLKASGRPDHKHDLRKKFHSQLKVLWQQLPLADYKDWYENQDPATPAKVNLNRKVGSFSFVPLVSPDLDLVCELQITMLRPEPPGALITKCGDIDNRLKTLFDSLRVPKNENELPKGLKGSPDEVPFFCLLEDDNLITAVSVRTDRYLVSPDVDSLVHLDIVVETRLTKMLTKRERSRQVSYGFALA
jgi:hypothetical protein